jgi:GNAT superfamily N-acetyltransferase
MLNLKAEPSKFDSEIFGVRVGCLRVPSLPETLDIRNANSGFFDVVFVTSEGWHEPSGAVALDWRYDMEAGAPQAHRNPVAVTRPDVARTLEVLDLAGTAFSDSRFLRDQKLSGRSGEFYRRWCSNAALDNRLFVCASGPPAFYVVKKVEDFVRVELIAVPSEMRGRGVGPGLLSGVMGACRRIRTSARNYRAIRSYQSSGFLVKSVSTAWHVWI